MGKQNTSLAISKNEVSSCKDEALVVGFFKDSVKLDQQLQKIDKSCNSMISSYLKSGKFKAEKGETKSIFIDKDIKNVVMVGLGEKEKYTPEIFCGLIADTSRRLKDSSFKSFTIYLESFAGKISSEELAEKAAISCLIGLYKFTDYKTKDENNKAVSTITLAAKSSNLESSLEYGKIIAEAMAKTRDIVNTPPNIADTEFVAKHAMEIAKKSGLKFTLFDDAKLKKMKMGCLLGVGMGSKSSPKLAILEYNGAGQGKKPLALVGKGVCFDSGGYNLKPYPYILNMKDDKTGALVVLHAIEACAKLKLKVNLIAVMPIVENMIDSNAYRPDDVLTAYNGMTVEIKNTDAEGRLILADALPYVAEKKPEAIIDLATLTGAASIAIGSLANPYMATDEKLAERIEAASKKSTERVWRLPLWPEYEEQIKSDIADIKNISEDGEAGTIIGGIFLKYFVNDVPWAHIDIAPTCWSKAEKGMNSKGSTGPAVRLIMDLIRDWK